MGLATTFGSAELAPQKMTYDGQFLWHKNAFTIRSTKCSQRTPCDHSALQAEATTSTVQKQSLIYETKTAISISLCVADSVTGV